MNNPEEAENYQVENKHTVQGQVVGRGNIVHQYFRLPQTRRAWIIMGAAVLVILFTATFVFWPKDPPSDWIANYTNPNGFPKTLSAQGVFYIHWNNQNNSLTGQMSMTTASIMGLKSDTCPLIGNYNSQDHSVLLRWACSDGTSGELSGTIADNTMTLAAGGDQQDQLVFRTGSSSDYQQAAQNLEQNVKKQLQKANQ